MSQEPDNVFQLELAGALAGTRALAMRLGLALLLGLPFVLARMPARARAVGLTMLVLFSSFFGAAVALVRRRADGHWQRLWLLPIPRWRVWFDYVLSSALVDLVQTGPLFALYVLVVGRHATAAGAVALAGLYLATVALLNVLGALLASMLSKNAEVHLAGALCVGLMAFASGLFPVSERLASSVGAVARWSPVGRLAALLEGLATGDPVGTMLGALLGGALTLVFAAATLGRLVAGRRGIGVDRGSVSP